MHGFIVLLKFRDIVLRYQHGLSTPDLRQTLPNLKNFLEHGLLVRCCVGFEGYLSVSVCADEDQRLGPELSQALDVDRHHASISIPDSLKSHLSVSVASEVGIPALSSSPERDIQKAADSDTDVLKNPTPPPCYNAVMNQVDPMITPELSPELAQEVEDVGKTIGTLVDGEQHLENPSDVPSGLVCTLAPTATPPHTGSMNGSVVPRESMGAIGGETCCSVEQAEEIMGTEATGLGLGLGGGARLDDFPCIPVEHAVAVECDEQVLGEFDAAGIEEVSRRIYALENMSSFRRPRKSSDK
ncbi:hypothetical protein DNTS_025585 [Danionella cerebrum]|uniref:Uncharacterized protein n=1 Tax=Danionella cerebrum TaxID=2873325 RepID=A0A553PYS1_9TELE|nr:hypothetical protein DNTS_025585 [Danionella translucida]